MTARPITVLGAGSFGTALAICLARLEQPVRLWGHLPDKIAAISKARCNQYYLPDVPLPENITLYTDLTEAIDGASDILIVVPSHAIPDVLQQLRPLIKPHVNLINASKGLTAEGGFLYETVIKQLPKEIPFLQLSGPSFAKEIALGLPTAVVLASNTIQAAHTVQLRFHQTNFRVYTSDDIIGVSLSGAAKNVMAIGAGIVDGLGFGANSRAALITRGLAEITKLGLILGAKEHTFMGLAGVGDLLLTCTDDQSRNRRMGLALGKGLSIKDAQTEIGQVVEGVTNTPYLLKLAEKHQVDMPLTSALQSVLNGELTARQALARLLAREARDE